eukprot:TRINITY_DN13640_c0_g1_i1.p1 TRINITY_DN13640_c0_g1~~TRINITY_DN13640_c0_g1_i1.p1  ORF type:complete len:174 (-),score=28.12 TRINITY_DN13640_c0_g1_i1:349-870(-)
MRRAAVSLLSAGAALSCLATATALLPPHTRHVGSWAAGSGCRARARACAPLRMAKEAPRLEDVPEKLKNEIFIVKEEETGRVVECYPDVFAVVNGQKYLVGHPCDWCVSIGKPDAEGNLEPIPLEGELMDEVFSTLQTMLEERGAYLGQGQRNCLRCQLQSGACVTREWQCVV